MLCYGSTRRPESQFISLHKSGVLRSGKGGYCSTSLRMLRRCVRSMWKRGRCTGYYRSNVFGYSKNPFSIDQDVGDGYELQCLNEYDPIFRPAYSTKREEPEKGLISGAEIVWVDDGTLRLKRRGILKWENGSPSTVLLVKKAGDANAYHKMKETAEWLSSHGLKVLVERPVAHSELPKYEAYQPKTHSVDLAVTFGGDGTVLHLASLFATDEPLPPTLSFAMGTLGFLTPFNASMARTVLSRLLWPPWEDEPIFCTLRSRKKCEVFFDGNMQRVYHVLNECVIDRGPSPSVVMLETFIDGRHVTTAHADALIIATPSGSTAYSMGAGGPMVAPSVPCTLITPVAPQSLSFRPLVVPETSVIEIHIPTSSRTHAARASFDGRNTIRLRRGSSIVCSTAEYGLPSINMHALDEDWFEGITAKLRWTGSITAGDPFSRRFNR